ncbi:Fe-S cluster assembly protein HesB [Spirillospora sp. CA-294931]|uniref:Fe-S cluster assembly protein HesB n=1 Tax=Spirillospora sp. CA-294931 TaxID=3240042 RepID=UPI003D8BEF46
MLSLTENAVTAIHDMTTKPELPTGTGIRIAPQQDDPVALVLVMSPGPVPGDEIIEVNGARLFLEPRAAEALNGRSLDVRMDGSGSVVFSLVG